MSLPCYDGLMIYGFRYDYIDHIKKFGKGKMYEGFRSYAKRRLLKLHGVTNEKFLYYLERLRV